MLFAWLTLNCMGSMELWRIKWGWFSLRFQNSTPLQNVCIVTLWQVYTQPLTWLSLLGGRDGELSSLSAAAAAAAAKSLQLCPTLCNPTDGRTSLIFTFLVSAAAAAAAAKLLQLCSTLCDPINGSPPGSTFPGILQVRTLEWVAISFSNAWKWKVKVKSLSHVWLLATPWTAAYQAPPYMGFARLEWVAIAFSIS